MQSQEVKRCVVKVWCTGWQATGKSRFCSKLSGGKYNGTPYEKTIGLDCCTIVVPHFAAQGDMVELQILDNSALGRSFLVVPRTYCRGTSVAIFVYDVTESASFSGLVTDLIPDFRRSHSFGKVEDGTRIFGIPGAPYVCTGLLVGTKTDLADSGEKKREVSTEEAAAFAEEHNLHFAEISLLEATQDELVALVSQCLHPTLCFAGEVAGGSDSPLHRPGAVRLPRLDEVIPRKGKK